MRSRSFAAVVFVLIVAGTVSVPLQAQDSHEDLVFIVAADMRNFAADGEWSKNFSGACEAVDEGRRRFVHDQPGRSRCRPPSAVRDMIDQTIGEDYPVVPGARQPRPGVALDHGVPARVQH